MKPTDAPGTLIGAGVAGAAAGGLLTDVLSAGLTGELITDAAAIGAVALGAGAAYAATRPDEAGEAARFVGGAVANTTTAYAELAAVSAELALLEQQQAAQAAADAAIMKAQARVDRTVSKIQAAPGKAADAIKAAPQKTANTITSKIQTSINSVQNSAQAQLDAARREIDQRK